MPCRHFELTCARQRPPAYKLCERREKELGLLPHSTLPSTLTLSTEDWNVLHAGGWDLDV